MTIEVCNDGKCGGCAHCIEAQSQYYLEKTEEKLKCAEQRIEELKEREQELIGKCIKKNTEYQVLLKMAKTYRDAQIKNPLARSESIALYWMNRALDLNNRVASAERREQGIRNEAEVYRNDHMKLIDWLCENGFGESCGNVADDVLNLANLYLKKIGLLKEFNDSMANELQDIVREAGKVLLHRGWKSKEYEHGVALKGQLNEIDAKIAEIKKCR